MSAKLACPPLPPPTADLESAPPLSEDDWFAIARVNGAIRLVQGASALCLFVLRPNVAHAVSAATPASALTTLDVKIFRHEFIHIFRFLEARTLHPADVHILERIPPGDAAAACDDDDTVFLARNVLARLSRLTAPPPRSASGYGYVQGYARAQWHTPPSHPGAVYTAARPGRA
ncbi:hypothetical protein GGX14DRAFT_468308, partial [Mycena pura]